MQIFKVDVPIFMTCIVCCHSCSAEDAMDAFYNHEGMRSRVQLPMENHKQGSVVPYEGDIYMWVKDPLNSPSLVFHELIHVFHTLREIKGMEFDEETEAYFMGWLKINVADVIFDEEYKLREDYHDSGE